MSTEIIPSENEGQKVKMHYQGGSSEAVYGLGMIGAWVYYISRAKTVQEGLAGFFKGMFWPAFLVYMALELLEKKE
jgi:hypothetical protein